MKWFRLYNGLRHDPKVQDLKPELFKFWVNLLCMASDQEERGTIPSIDAISTDLGMRRDYVARFIGELERRQLVVKGVLSASYAPLKGAKEALRIHAWDARQPLSDDVSVRVNAYRARVSAKKNNATQPPLKRYSDPPCNVLDSDSDVSLNEKQKTPLRPPTGGEQQDRVRPDQCTCKSDRPRRPPRESRIGAGDRHVVMLAEERIKRRNTREAENGEG